MRPRKLLLHRRQIAHLESEQQESCGWRSCPLRVYFTHGIAKVEIGLGKGKRQFEKRQSIAKRDAEREIEQARRPAPLGLTPPAHAVSRRPYTSDDNCIWGCTGFDLDVHRPGEAGRDPGCHVKRRTKHKRQ